MENIADVSAICGQLTIGVAGSSNVPGGPMDRCPTGIAFWLQSHRQISKAALHT